MNVLYDAGYLTIANSEYAISLLSESEFKEGIVKGVPNTVRVAHKYGEWGEPGSRELHESALIYMNKSPYLLTIMTKGTDSKKLAEAVSRISRITYDDMVANN
jgi:beta-lactamase class A